MCHKHPNYHEGKAVYINESRLLFELIQTFSKITRTLIFEKLLKVMYIFIDKKIISGVGCVTNIQTITKEKRSTSMNLDYTVSVPKVLHAGTAKTLL